jgi:hypothetical protein
MNGQAETPGNSDRPPGVIDVPVGKNNRVELPDLRAGTLQPAGEAF